MSLRRSKLLEEAVLLQYIDKAMVREGIDKMADAELEKVSSWVPVDRVYFFRVSPRPG